MLLLECYELISAPPPFLIVLSLKRGNFFKVSTIDFLVVSSWETIHFYADPITFISLDLKLFKQLFCHVCNVQLSALLYHVKFWFPIINIYILI